MTILGPKEVEVKKGLRKMHNEELHDLHSSSNVIRAMKSKSKSTMLLRNR
jgi:hypothetical protein